MDSRKLTPAHLDAFAAALQRQEKSAATVEKYRRDAARAHLQSGPVFLTRGGKPMDRTAIWAQMKALCRRAGVAAEKVFPHNLRHLFSRIPRGKKKHHIIPIMW
jgi:integrase